MGESTSVRELVSKSLCLYPHRAERNSSLLELHLSQSKSLFCLCKRDLDKEKAGKLGLEEPWRNLWRRQEWIQYFQAFTVSMAASPLPSSLPCFLTSLTPERFLALLNNHMRNTNILFALSKENNLGC